MRSHLFSLHPSI
jgi:hypothetical protein